MICDRCGAHMDYLGVDDGGGVYGDSVCDTWECPECGFSDETNCREVPDYVTNRESRSWIVRAVDEAIAEEEDDDPTAQIPF